MTDGCLEPIVNLAECKKLLEKSSFQRYLRLAKECTICYSYCNLFLTSSGN